MNPREYQYVVFVKREVKQTQRSTGKSGATKFRRKAMFSRAIGKQYQIPHLYNEQCVGTKEITGFGNLEVTGGLAWIDFCG